MAETEIIPNPDPNSNSDSNFQQKNIKNDQNNMNSNSSDNNKSNNNNRRGSIHTHRRHLSSGNVDFNISVISSQYEISPQHATPVLIKKSGFMDPIYKILGFTTKNEENELECTPREIGTFIMLILLIIVFMTSGIGFFIMWFTEVYNNQYTSQLVLSNNSLAAKWWMHPPINPHLKVHIFNYTNVDRYVKGLDKKLKLEDLGPYVYAENSTKVNVVFNKIIQLHTRNIDLTNLYQSYHLVSNMIKLLYQMYHYYRLLHQ